MKNFARAAGALLLSLSLCGLSNFAVAAPAKAAAKTAKPAAAGKKPAGQRMLAAIAATPDQKKKIGAIQKAQKAQIKAIQDDKKLSADAKKTKVKAARKAGNDKIDALLTAAQKPKMAAFRKQMKAENMAKAKAKKAKK